FTRACRTPGATSTCVPARAWGRPSRSCCRERPVPDARILVVDDEQSMRELLSITLRQAGYDVTLADGGTEAIERMREESFDLIVTDLRMHDADGMAVL